MPDVLISRLARPEIPALNGIRAIAVLLVVLFHFGFRWVPGPRGVAVFFVLSGFLITWLMLKEHDRSGTVSLRRFYWRRTLRIFPAFYAYWLCLVALALLRGRDVAWPHAWSAFFYVSNYYTALVPHPDNAFSPTWSLAVEEQFYLLWPCAFLLIARDFTRLTRLLLLWIGAIAVYRLVLVYGLNVDQRYIYSAFDTRVDNLLVGCLFAVLLHRGAVPRLWRTVTSHPALPLVTIGLIVLSVAYGPAMVARYRDVVAFAIEPWLFAIAIVQLIALSGSRWWAWLDSRPLRYVGIVSYPIYLYHSITLYPIRTALADWPLIVQVAAALAVTVGVASLSYFVVELPCLKLKHRGASPQMPRAEAAAAL